MKLLMISGDRALASGKKGAFYNTLEELHKHFDRIDIICPKAKTTSYEMSVFGNVFVHASPWPLFLQWIWIWYRGRRIVHEHAPAIATVHDYAPFYNGVGACLLKFSTGLPFILEIMHVPGYPHASGFRENFYRWLTSILIAQDARHAKAVRVINKTETPEFLVAAGVPRSKLEYIPAFYIDLTVFSPQEMQKQYDVIFVGRLARNKGVDVFLEVIQKADVTALVVGEGPLLGWAKKQCRRRRLKVNFHGFAKDTKEIAECINRARVLVMTSLSEGGPRVVLEALACGVPVVATPVGIVPDVLPPECIEEWSAPDIAAKVRNLLADDTLYSRVRESGLFMTRQFERSAAIAVYATRLKEIAERV
jgi:glycosyltransferase involved in cell wall biosynthesis